MLVYPKILQISKNLIMLLKQGEYPFLALQKEETNIMKKAILVASLLGTLIVVLNYIKHVQEIQSNINQRFFGFSTYSKLKNGRQYLFPKRKRYILAPKRRD